LKFFCFGNPYYDKREVTEDVAQFLQELAVADGSIFIENMPVELLDEAVRLFNHQRRGQLLRSFGKCIRSLFGFSSSLYEVELPNMRRLEVFGTLDGTSKNGDFARTVSWPKLEGVNVGLRKKEADISCMAKLVFGSGVFRPSVRRLSCALYLLTLDSNEAHLGLANFPSLTHLELRVSQAQTGLLRSLMRVLPSSCSKIQYLGLNVAFPLGDGFFLGADGEVSAFTPHLLQFPGK
jgi:hypothetical protein